MKVAGSRVYLLQYRLIRVGKGRMKLLSPLESSEAKSETGAFVWKSSQPSDSSESENSMGKPTPKLCGPFDSSESESDAECEPAPNSLGSSDSSKSEISSYEPTL